MQPHQASATIKTRKAMGELQFQNILNYFENGTLNFSARIKLIIGDQ